MRIERIYQALRRQICLLDLPPGVVLREQDLADQFQVSRTPIRHVLGRLAADGLVESRQGVGTTVTTVNPDDMLDIYYLRAVLAEAIGDSDPDPATPDTLEAMRALSERCTTLRGTGGDIRAFGEVNMDFHALLFSVVRSRPLREISDRLFFQTARIWFQVLEEVTWERALGELKNEIDEVRHAMARGDLKAVGHIHRAYVFTVLVVLRRILSEHHRDKAT